MKIISELEKLGLELSDDQKTAITKKFSEDVITNSEHLKKIGDAETDRDNWKEKAETAETTLKGFEGKDFEAITKERNDWQKKAEDAEKTYKAQLDQRDYTDAVNKAVEGLKFSSNSAKKAFIADLTADPLKMKDGSLLGFKDYVEAYKKNDEGAFIDDADPDSATFTEPMGGTGKSEPITGDPNKMDYSTYKKWREQNA